MVTVRTSGTSFPRYACLGALMVAFGVVACGNEYAAFRVFIEVGGYAAVTGTGGSESADGSGGAEGANGGAGGDAGAKGNGGAGPTGGAMGAGGTVGGTVSTGGTGTGGLPPSTGGDTSTGGISSTGGTGTGGLPPSTGGTSTGGDMSTGGISSTGGCAGVLDSGICWYHGALGANCATTCATHGGSSPEAASHVGTTSQGGSLSECTRLLGLLGMTGTVNSGTRSDGQGMGCHVFTGPAYWWLSSPAYSDTASLASVRIVCGCVQ